MWRQAGRSLSCGQAETLERRVHAVWREVYVRQGGLLGSSAPEAASTGRSPEASLRSKTDYGSSPAAKDDSDILRCTLAKHAAKNGLRTIVRNAAIPSVRWPD